MFPGWGKLRRVSLYDLDGQITSIAVTVILTTVGSIFYVKGLLVVAVLTTTITLASRSMDYVEAYRLHEMSEAGETTRELIEYFADQLNVETPIVRVQTRANMRMGGGKEMYGYAAPNPFGRDVVVLNEVADTVIEARIDAEDKKDVLSVLAHEVAHTGQRPRVALLQSLTVGVPYFVAACASFVTTYIHVLVGVAVLTAVVRRIILTYWSRQMEYDADVKAVELAGSEAVREYYDDVEPSWCPFSTSPSDWRRVQYLRSRGLL